MRRREDSRNAGRPQAPILVGGPPFRPLDAGPLLEPLRASADLSLNEEVLLSAEQCRALELRQVQVKEAFTLTDAGGTWFRASLRECGPRGGRALVYERMPAAPESPLAITLLCAVLARQRMLVLMQKATELGVAHIVPVYSTASVQREGLDHEKWHGWPGQVLRACKQCRRSSVPSLRAPLPLAGALELPGWQSAERRLVLDDVEGAAADWTAAPPRTLALAVGPEGGWTEAERSLLREAGGEVLRLGGRVLRAETAVLVGLSVLQHRLGDLN